MLYSPLPHCSFSSHNFSISYFISFLFSLPLASNINTHIRRKQDSSIPSPTNSNAPLLQPKMFGCHVHIYETQTLLYAHTLPHRASPHTLVVFTVKFHGVGGKSSPRAKRFICGSQSSFGYRTRRTEY